MAIDVHELRVGNFIHYKGSIIEVDLGFFHSWAINSLEYEWEKLKPIPLSPEILGYLGFVDTKARLAGNPDRIIEWSNGDYEIIRDGDDDYYLVLATDEYGDAIKTIEIKYAHRLQNVIFALTQTELTYSPIK